jgi:hypothetical protein
MQIEWKRTFQCAFAAFGAKAANPYYWAAQSEDGRTVALTMWLDELQFEDDRLVYGLHPRTCITKPNPRPAARDRISKLKQARDRCDGRLLGIPIDRTTNPKRKRFLIDASLWMKIHWIEDSGKFCLRSIDPLNDGLLKEIRPLVPRDARGTS